MKKILAITLSAAMILSLAACGSSDSSSASSSTSSNSAEEASTEAEPVGWQSGDTVYIDVPAKAGGGTDLYARYVTQAMTEILDGVNFVVTNYDTSEVGSMHAKNADPDGLTLLPIACTTMDNYLSGQSDLNPLTDMKVVAKINDGGPQALIAAPDAPYDNVPELVEYAKEHPEEVTIGCSLGGTSQLIWICAFNAMGDDIWELFTYVQCSSEADKLTNVASGSIDLGNCSISNAVSYEEAGKVKVIGTVGPESATLESMSELCGFELSEAYKSMPEQGIDATWDAGYYLVAPLGTPDNIIEGINEQLMALNDSETYEDGMKNMATFYEIKNVEDSTSDCEAEWEYQINLMNQMDLNVREEYME